MCGAYEKFDKDKNIAVDCNSEESYMPGTFCVKITRQSPRGFICKFTVFKFCIIRYLALLNNLKHVVRLLLRPFDNFIANLVPICLLFRSIFEGDGRWRQVIRRCSSVASTGVTGVCNWGVYENGVYWEECSCSENSCNTASTLSSFSIIILLSLAISIIIFSLR